jgi:hypothetical protein
MKNVLFLVLDSLRYDVFVKAETPNFDAIGKTRRVHSFACFTIPSIIGFFMGWPPIGAGTKTLFPEVPKYEWVPRHFKKQGYYTAWLSRNALLLKLDAAIGGQFTRGFDLRKVLEYGDARVTTKQIIADVCSITKTQMTHPIFASLLLLDTHRPYAWGSAVQDIVPSNPVLNFANQVKATEYVDSLFPQIKQAFIDTGRKTRVIITSDHGELFGPDYWSHDPSSQKCPIQFDEKLFEIPLIIGEF